MTAIVIESHIYFSSKGLNPSTFNNSDDSITELYRLPRLQSSVWSVAAKEVLLARSSEFAVDSLSSLRSNISSVDEESAADTLLADAPNAVQAFFQRAESYLSARTEITSQFALKLLQRIKTMIAEICPSDLQGRVLALVDEEDGSTTIEWIRNRSRLGFVLDREDESSWFVVLPDGLSKSGYLYGIDGLKSLRTLLEEFVTTGE